MIARIFFTTLAACILFSSNQTHAADYDHWLDYRVEIQQRSSHVGIAANFRQTGHQGATSYRWKSFRTQQELNSHFAGASWLSLIRSHSIEVADSEWIHVGNEATYEEAIRRADAIEASNPGKGVYARIVPFYNPITIPRTNDPAIKRP